MAAHRRVENTRRLALPFRLLFVAAVVGLGAGVLFVASGGIGRVADALGSTVTGFVDDITATPVPSEVPPELAEAPSIEKPDEPYTNQPTVDLVGTIPEDAAGVAANRIRLYVAIGDGEPGIVTEIPVGRTTRFIIPGVSLSEGTNSFSATIVSSAGESDPSPVVAYVLDTAIPRIVLSKPANGSVVNAKSATIEGETQARSEISIWNATTNETVTGAADENGKFSISIPIVAGQNDIGIQAIDPAGNANHDVIAVSKGSGKLAAQLAASAYSIDIDKLPERIELNVTVTDPDGRPIEGATVTFALAVPGVPAVTSKALKTGGDGTATWRTTIPKGATVGQISATVIVRTTKYGDTTDRTVINLQD
ncbi:MAG TPA: Ig-like domain-containing protein [Candidatus Limnocylindrales bacterium]|nr:Ig-like domain-containing protein [Candidatus Limnocylindrales bacterium]